MAHHDLQFNVMAADEIRGRSVVEVTKTVLSLAHREDTCLDPRMGCMSSNERCVTCGSSANECPGHFGHIELGTHFYHPYFITELYRTIKHSCPLCRTYHPKASKDCTRCGAIAGTWSRRLRRHAKSGFKDKLQYTYTERSTGHVNVVNPSTDAICAILKQCGKETLLLSVLPVPPMCMRPSIVMSASADGASKCSHDSLTLAYVLIVRESTMLKTFMKYRQAAHILKHQWRRVQDAVYQIYDTSRTVRDSFAGSSASMVGAQGIRQRLDGKQGRFRQNLLGKRTDFSARTVITADPSLDLDQVGVPRSIAMRLTKPVVATPFNVEDLRQRVRVGPNELGGALYVQKKTHPCIDYDLAFVSSVEDVASKLRYGDVVERMLVDDDWVAVNRKCFKTKKKPSQPHIRLQNVDVFFVCQNVLENIPFVERVDPFSRLGPETLTRYAQNTFLCAKTSCW